MEHASERLGRLRRGAARPTGVLVCAAVALLTAACASAQMQGAETDVLLIRGDSPASAGSDAAALQARMQIVADRCVGAVASGRTYLLRFPSDTSWDGRTVLIPGSPALRVGDEVTFGGSGTSLDAAGRDRDVPAQCASAADEIWYVGGARLD